MLGRSEPAFEPGTGGLTGTASLGPSGLDLFASLNQKKTHKEEENDSRKKTEIFKEKN